MILQTKASAINSRHTFEPIESATLKSLQVKLASKTIKKTHKLLNTKNSKLVKADPFPLLVTIATQENSNVSLKSVAKTVICQDVKMLLSLNKYVPSVKRPLQSLKWIKRKTKQSVKKQEISQKPRLMISIPLIEDNFRSI